MPPPDSDNKRTMPKFKNPKEFFIFFFKEGKSFLYRLFYIVKLVWDARPWILFVMTFMAVFNGVSPILGSYISKMMIDKLAEAARLALEGNVLEGGFWALGGLIILQLAYQFFVTLVSSISHMITRLSNEIIVYSIKLKIQNKAKTIDLSSFDLPEFYSKLENANREAGGRPLQIIEAIFSLFSTLISMISFIVILATIIPIAPPIIIIMSIPSAIIHYKYRKKMFNYVRRRSKDRRQMDYFSNLLVNKDLVKEVKLFDLAETFIAKYKEVFKNYYKGIRTIIVQEGIWGIVLSLLRNIVNGTIFLKIAHLIFKGTLTVGDYTLYSSALFSISGSVNSLVNISATVYEGTLYIDNMIAFMEEEPQIVSKENALPVQHHAPHTIEFKNVSFRYPGTERFVLKNINMKIDAGETVVLVGLNGAGKTTLLKLLTRLYDPSEGEILFDGHNIKEYDVKDLYSVFGIIFQDFGKYSFTLRENISFGQISRKDDFEHVKDSATKSSATEFINHLPDTYDTPLTKLFEENGIELSIGQWQKVAVARAFFRDSDIMILDEPTASLDPIAEQEIFSQFDDLRGDNTTIFVSHRLSSATIASKIILLEYGEILEMGSHRELMAKNGRYAELFNTQAKRYIENAAGTISSEEAPSGRRPDMKFPPDPDGRSFPPPPNFRR